MKIRRCQNRRVALLGRSERGMAVIVVIALFAIMMLFMGMALQSLNFLRQDLKIIERQQVQRIQQASATKTEIRTNALLRVELGAANSIPSFNQP